MTRFTKTISELLPETTRKGDLVEFTDGRGRRCVGKVWNIDCGGPTVYFEYVDGVDREKLCQFHPAFLKWADKRIRTANELAIAQGKKPPYEEN